jgi:small nuclear ribonucleoprotein (snRNP)-like protein
MQTLASFDQFNNLVLLETVERRIVRLKDPKQQHDNNDPVSPSIGCSTSSATGHMQCYYCDIPMGIFLVRGDSMVLVGAVNDDENYDDTAADRRLLRPVSTLAELARLQEMAEPAIEWDFDGDLAA